MEKDTKPTMELPEGWYAKHFNYGTAISNAPEGEFAENTFVILSSYGQGGYCKLNVMHVAIDGGMDTVIPLDKVLSDEVPDRVEKAIRKFTEENWSGDYKGLSFKGVM